MTSRTRILVIASLFWCLEAHSGPTVVFVDIDPENPGPSLDEAIALANSGTPTVARFGSETFVFDNSPVNGGFTQIGLAGDLTLLGSGAVLTGNGPNGGRLISVVIDGHLSVEGLNFRNFGASIAGGGSGGVINLEGGGLHVSHSVFQRNFAAIDGGALSIFNATEDILIENSDFIDNRAAINGGAIDFENQMSGGDVRFRLVNTTFEVNKAVVSGCTFDVLDARAPASPDRFQLHNVTVIDGDCIHTTLNHPFGAIAINASLLAVGPDGLDSAGLINMAGSTFFDVELINGSTPTTVASRAVCNDFGTGSFNSLGFNLSSDNTCGLDQASDLPDTDPMVTRDGDGKFRLVSGSPLIDSASVDLIEFSEGESPILPCGYKDANGAARPQDGDLDGEFACDIGNIEKQGGGNITGAQTSAYFDLTRPGEGVFVELLPGNVAFLAMFSYQPDASGLLWMVGVGVWDANYVVIDDVLVTSGGVFGPGFDADQIVRRKVGGMSMNFPTCQADSRPGKIAFQAGMGSGLEDLLVDAFRLSTILNCTGDTAPGSSGRSGSFFDVNRDGEGIFVQWLTDGRVLLIWYTYDSQGNQFWIISDPDNTTVNGGTVTANMLFPSSLSQFGSGFDPDEVVLDNWGTVTLEYTSCDTINFSYDSNQPGFGSGAFDYSRLTSISGADCAL